MTNPMEKVFPGWGQMTQVQRKEVEEEFWAAELEFQIPGWAKMSADERETALTALEEAAGSALN